MTTTFIEDAAGRQVIEKDPNEVLDYSVNWTAYLALTSDSISSQQIVQSGLTLGSSTFAGAIQTAWLSGGTVGEKVQVTFRIVTTGGRTVDRSIYIKLKER